MSATVIPAAIVNARLLAWVDDENVTDAQAIIMVDDIYQELIDLKKETSEDFLHQTAFIDTLLYQNKYTLPTWYRDIEKILLFSAKYSAPTYTAWAASTVYAVWDKCLQGGRSYICNLAHTSTASFKYTQTYTTSVIMVAGETITINGLVYTATAAGAATDPGDFAIGGNEATCLINLMKVVKSETAGTVDTFIAISDYHKQLNTDIELVITNPTGHTINITTNISITTSETSIDGARGAETGGNWIEIREGDVNVVQQKVDYAAMERFNEVSNDNPVFFFMEQEIRLYPKPQEAVTRGIMIDYIQKLPTLTATVDDAELYLEDKFEKALLYGIAYKMQEFISVDSALFNTKYEMHKAKAGKRWANRFMNKVTEQLPALHNYSRNGR